MVVVISVLDTVDEVFCIDIEVVVQEIFRELRTFGIILYSECLIMEYLISFSTKESFSTTKLLSDETKVITDCIEVLFIWSSTFEMFWKCPFKVVHLASSDWQPATQRVKKRPQNLDKTVTCLTPCPATGLEQGWDVAQHLLHWADQGVLRTAAVHLGQDSLHLGYLGTDSRASNKTLQPPNSLLINVSLIWSKVDRVVLLVLPVVWTTAVVTERG